MDQLFCKISNLKLHIPKYILVFICLFASRFAAAQNPVHRVLDFKTGLPSNTIYNIYQDKKGYIWIAHDKGLSRYNGHSFKHYAGGILQSRGLSNIQEDHKGRIWCQNFAGEIFYTEGDKLVSDTVMPSVGNIIPFSIYNGTKLLTIQKGKLISRDIDNNSVATINTGNIELPDNNLLLHDEDVFAFGPKGTLVNLRALKYRKSFALDPSESYFISCWGNGRVYSFSRNGGNAASWLDEASSNSHNVKLNLDAVIQYVTIVNSEIWISTSNGIYRYNKDLQPMNGGKPYFVGNNVSRLIVDREGVMWVSTLNKGVLIIPDFQLQTIATGASSITTAAYFTSINKIILGTGDNRILELNPFNNTVSVLKELGPPTDVLHIYNDVGNDRIWIASDKLYSLVGGVNFVESATPVPMKDIHFLGDGFYTMATPEGIVLVRKTPDSTDQSFAMQVWGKKIPWKNDRQLLPGSEGRAKAVEWDNAKEIVYGANYKGLFSWSKKGGMQRYKLGGKDIYASDLMLIGSKLYIGTYDGRLLILENGKIIQEIQSFKGNPGGTLMRLRQYNEYVWLLYENSLVRYNTRNNTYKVFSTASGLPNTEIKDIVIQNGIVYLATRDGLISFKENFQARRESPTIYIEDVAVNHAFKPSRADLLNLRTNENNLEIEISVLSYRNNANLKVLYSLNDEEWLPIGGTGRLLQLVGLAPGKYVVRFKAVTADGREIPAAEMLTFKIAAPIYARWWFILLLLLFISSIVYFFMRFRIYELKKEAAFKSEKDKLQRELQISTLTSIKSQMNPHFVFNALNTVQSYIFTNEKENASDYLSKFSELTRMVLDMSSKEKITLTEEIKALRLYLDLEKKRFEDTIEYQIVVNGISNPDLIQIPSMLIQPYVENAIKHGLLHKKGERKLKIEFLREGNAVIAFIDDNGIGRKKSNEMKMLKPSSHKSFASEANSKRLAILNQGRENTIDIEYLDKSDSYGHTMGTMVILAIPLNF
jgi:ligand-binding sensor domain-containing protein/signal transduction histidine kinase